MYPCQAKSHPRCKSCASKVAGNTPPPGKPMDIDMFMEKVQVKDSGCWEWQGCVNEGGYGIVGNERRVERAHRFSYKLLVGPIPPGMCICHKCDNRKCVNPEHLWPGTQKENIQDALQKGRLKPGGKDCG